MNRNIIFFLLTFIFQFSHVKVVEIPFGKLLLLCTLIICELIQIIVPTDRIIKCDLRD